MASEVLNDGKKIASSVFNRAKTLFGGSSGAVAEPAQSSNAPQQTYKNQAPQFDDLFK